jgi:hypothetical protein
MISKWIKYDDVIKQIYSEEKTGVEMAQSILNIKANSKQNNDVKELGRYISRHGRRIADIQEGIYEAANRLGVSIMDAKTMWLKDEGASIQVKNPNYVPQEIQRVEILRSELIADLQLYRPTFTKIKREICKDAHLLVIDPADIHIGKLCSAFETGEDYNSQIAVKRVLDGVNGILSKVSAYNIDKILFIGGNDILHVDNAKSSTTSLTQQDTDGMWYDNFMIAKKLYTDVLELLLSVADVHFTFNPSNHDYTNGFFLAQIIETYFKNCSNITFDCSIAHRKAYQYHNNLIGTTHGDGAKQQDLPLLMALEYSKEWADTKHRYIYTHHIHHKTSKDYAGVTVESLRSSSGTDSWHHRNGYLSIKAVEGFLHHKQHGQVARINHLF